MFKSFLNALGTVLVPFRQEHFPELDVKLRYTLTFLQNVGFAGIICIVLRHLGNAWQDAALGALTALAFFGIGSLAGFILALPRVSLEETPKPLSSRPQIAENSGAKPVDPTRKPSLIGFNNNLVDISDWITKSILALSLANYRDLIPDLQGAAAYVAIGNSSVARAEAMVIILGFGSIGVLYAYISTRTLVTSLLRDSATESLGREITKSLDDQGRSALKFLNPDKRGDEPSRREAKITQAEKDTANKIASQTAQVPLQTIRSQIAALAQQYVDIRTGQKPGPERTRAMEEIAAKMRALSRSAVPLLSELKTSNSAGERLAAISILELNPSFAETAFLKERVALESAFIGYHAALALKEIAAVLDCEEKPSFLHDLSEAKNAVPPASDRANVLEQAMEIVRQRCPD